MGASQRLQTAKSYFSIIKKIESMRACTRLRTVTATLSCFKNFAERKNSMTGMYRRRFVLTSMASIIILIF